MFARAAAKRWVRWAGWAATIASVGYILWRFSATDALRSLVSSGQGATLLLRMLLGGAIYLLGLSIFSLAWWQLQSAFTKENPPLLEVTSIYAVSQFAKYLPGNVAHYLTRHSLLRRLALPHGSLLACAIAEAGGVVIAALCWALPAEHGLLARALGIRPAVLLAVLAGAALLGVSALAWAARRWNRLRAWIPAVRPLRLLPVLFLYPIFFAFMGLAVAVSAHGISPAAVARPAFAGVLSTSWLAGFLVVGSPAGLGVRETVLLALLRGHGPEGNLLLLAAAFRGTTFVGDFLFFLSGGLLRRFVLGPRAGQVEPAGAGGEGSTPG